MPATSLAAANFKWLSKIVLYKEIYVQGRLRLNLGKIHRRVQILCNLEFFEVQFRCEFREVQVLSKIVLDKCR